jgi:hypothetical protein
MSEKVNFEGRKVRGPFSLEVPFGGMVLDSEVFGVPFVQTLDIFAIIKNRYLVDFSDEESSF